MKTLKPQPKKHWIRQFKDNTAITDVMPGPDSWVALTPSTKPFSDFINESQNRIFTNGVSIAPNFKYDEIVQYAHQNAEYKIKRVNLYTSDFVLVKQDWGRVMFVPYSDGVMLYGINIKPELRGNGIGTDIINKLYDLSEEMNIPIYLIPYPDDNFPTKDEKELVDKLKAYYERLGFGPVSDKSLVWCNMY